MTLPFHYVADTVMGGVSRGTLTQETVKGRDAWRLRGSVRLENNGGFIQMAADLAALGPAFDPAAHSGIAFSAISPSLGSDHQGEAYNVHLRTSDLTRPWQSYRQSFIAGAEWTEHRIPFADFQPHRTEQPFEKGRLQRLGFLAIGRAFEADLAIADVAFY